MSAEFRRDAARVVYKTAELLRADAYEAFRAYAGRHTWYVRLTPVGESALLLMAQHDVGRLCKAAEGTGFMNVYTLPHLVGVPYKKLKKTGDVILTCTLRTLVRDGIMRVVKGDSTSHGFKPHIVDITPFGTTLLAYWTVNGRPASLEYVLTADEVRNGDVFVFDAPPLQPPTAPDDPRLLKITAMVKAHFKKH